MTMQGSAAKSRVFVVDDHPIVRQGLAMLINREPDLEVCGEAEEAQAAIDAIARMRPDILIVDISLTGPDGLDLIKAIRAIETSPPVLVLSMHDESIYAERALRAGASGYIMKQEGTERVSDRPPPHPQGRSVPERSCCQPDGSALRPRSSGDPPAG